MRTRNLVIGVIAVWLLGFSVGTILFRKQKQIDLPSRGGLPTVTTCCNSSSLVSIDELMRKRIDALELKVRELH